MTKYIDKSILEKEIKRQISAIDDYPKLTNTQIAVLEGDKVVLTKLLSFLDTLEVKEVDLELEQRIKECPFRQVVCNKYENTPVECDCNCSWVVDYPKLKELKAQKKE